MPILTTPPKRTTQLDDEQMKSTIRNQLTIGSNIYHRRKYKGLSQQTLAEKANITQSIVSELEAGEYNPSIEVLTKIADALKVSIEYLTREHFNRRFLETLDYFIAHLRNVDVLKLMKLLYFTDVHYHEKNGMKFTGTKYLRRYAGPFNKDIYLADTFFTKNGQYFTPQSTLAKRLTLTKNDEQFLDSIIAEYGKMSSVEIKKRSYATTPMQ